MKNEKRNSFELFRKSVNEIKTAPKNNISIVLDNIRSAQNVGSFFRTCDAFNVEKIYLCGITATPPNKEIFKTALGSTESVDWQCYETTTECIEFLKLNNFQKIQTYSYYLLFCLFQFSPNLKSDDVKKHNKIGSKAKCRINKGSRFIFFKNKMTYPGKTISTNWCKQ